MSRMLAPRYLVCAILISTAIFYLGYRLVFLGFDTHDAGLYETVLARAAAGQIENGFGTLYGPFSGENPSVLMHAPGFYRLTGLVAVAPSRLGLSPLIAVLISGRAVSFLATIAILGAACRLARLDGRCTRFATLFSAALIASSPILGLLSVMVRSDTLGVALGAWGIVLLLEGLRDAPGRPATVRPALAYGAFALAIGVKQQNLVAPAIGAVLLLQARLQGRLTNVAVMGPLLVGSVILFGGLAVEDSLTSGHARRAILELPGGAFRSINFAGWSHTAEVLRHCLTRSVGLIAIGLSCLLAANTWRGWQKLDSVLVVFLLAEVAALLPLCLYNQGSADNYALAAVVLASVLTGRALDRALHTRAWASPVLALILLSVLLLGLNDVRLVRLSIQRRTLEREQLASVLSDPRVSRISADQRYFVGDQSYNRLHGNRRLIHDEWLYGAFESIGEAQPRDEWLREALTTGPVRLVVTPNATPRVPGIGAPLPSLGYHPISRRGAFTIWSRDLASAGEANQAWFGSQGESREILPGTSRGAR